MTAGPPERLIVHRLATPIGEALIVADEAGVLRGFHWAEYEDALRRTMSVQYGAVPVEAGRAAAIAAGFDAYFAGEVTALERLPWDTGGTAFQRRVWAALAAIPAGVTLSYMALAASIGRPMAIRAAGHANGRNPICVALPCHRVIGADGSLTGYGGGLARKRWLLRHEGADFCADALA